MKTFTYTFEISDEALNFLAKEGYNPHYGARPLNRLIQNKILNPVASHIISNKVKKGDKVMVSIKNNEILIDTKKGKIKSYREIASELVSNTTNGWGREWISAS